MSSYTGHTHGGIERTIISAQLLLETKAEKNTHLPTELDWLQKPSPCPFLIQVSACENEEEEAKLIVCSQQQSVDSLGDQFNCKTTS